MRVLHVSPYFAPAFCYGGPPRSILGLCRALQGHGADVSVFTTTANGGTDLPVSPAHGDIYDGVPVKYFRRATPRRFFGAAGLAAALDAALPAQNLVHIHCLWNWTSWMAARRARHAGVPYAISTRGMLEPAALSHGAGRKQVAWRAVERSKLLAAAFVHATSAEEARTVRALAPGVPVIVLPNAVDPPSAPIAPGAYRRRLGIGPTAPLIVFLGRIHPIKRLDLLANAFARLQETAPEAHLAIAGAGRPSDERSAQAAFSASGVHVHWLGEIGENEKWSLLADATLLALCSDSENFGMSVAEALAVGVPVVVTRTCPWEEIETVSCGRWVAQEPAALAGAMAEIISNPQAARGMGERGRVHAARRFAWGPIAHEMLGHYQTAIAGRLRQAS